MIYVYFDYYYDLIFIKYNIHSSTTKADNTSPNNFTFKFFKANTNSNRRSSI